MPSIAPITSIIATFSGERAKYTPPFNPRRDLRIPAGFNLERICDKYAGGHCSGSARAAAETVVPSGCLAKAITAEMAYCAP